MNYIQWIRSHVGHQRIFLVFSSVVLSDEQGRILLQRRTDFKVWGLPGGSLELGENIIICARRELEEETGLTTGELKLVGVYTDPKYESTYPNGDKVQQFTICLTGQVSGGQMRVDGTENSVQRFFAPDDLPFDETLPWYADMLHDALRRGGSPTFEPPYTRPRTTPQWETLRPRIGNKRFIGVGGTAVLVRGDGRILMMQRSDDGQWGLPGGFSNLGENVAYTAIRETQEETGVIAKPERILGVYTDPKPWIYPHGDEVQVAVVVFRMSWTGETANPEGDETRGTAWMTPDEILSLDTRPIYTRVHKLALAHLDGGYFIV